MKRILSLFVLLILSAGIPGLVSGRSTTILTPTVVEMVNMMDITPALSGPGSVCLNSSGNVYSTDGGQTNYVWSVSGGTITAGGNGSSSTATVTWTSAGSKSISVSYSGSGVTTLPVTVNPLTASISITVSANPVTAGTMVTFTATPVNGGTSPYYHWKVNGADAGTNSPAFSYNPVNGDAVYCLLTSSAPCVTADFTSNIITMTVNPASTIQVSLPTITATPGQSINVPVKISGAGSSGTPITGANLHITYDSTKLVFVGLTNFYAPMPSGQWSYYDGFDPDCSAHSLSANWIEPNLNAVSVPDNTTLFEMQFTYVSGNNPLTYCIYEFTDVNVNLVTTTPVNGAVNMLIENPTLTGPASVCLNSTGNVYTTDAGKSNYSWTLSGGTITAGGNSASNTATVTWTSAGSKNISVSYQYATTTTLPVTVNVITASVSIAASANPVSSGTSVTFTATPVNGGSSPSYQWKVNGSDAGTNSPVFTFTPQNGDAVYCLLTSNAPCVSALFTSNVITMNVTAGAVSVTMPTLISTPGQTVNVPVKLTGAGSSGFPISGANIHITYDSTKLTFTGLVNFYGSMPSSQWSYFDGFDPDCQSHAIAANWIEPNFGTVAVPDGTTLFEVQFTHVAGDCPLLFCINEFTDININLLQTTPTNGAVNQPVIPVLSGPVSACQGSSGNVYTTDPGKSVYNWQITGGVITSGGSGNTNTATVTWTTTGSQSISVSYSGSSTTTLPVTVNAEKTLTLKAFLEGLYAGNGTMNQAFDEYGPHFGPGIADQVTVELHSEISYQVIEYSGVFDLTTNGNIIINSLPCNLTGNYYITLKHRNCIETVSSSAIPFNGSSVAYDFSSGLTQAFADNLKDNGNGEFSIWTGDVNQDGLVDSGDMNPVDNSSTLVVFGYVPEDINGDGIVDSGDMNFVDNNSTAVIIAYTP